MSDSTALSKRCNHCQREFPATNECFHRNTREKDGLCRTCKECAKARSRQWLLDNPERAKETGKQYYAEHRDEIIQRVTDYAKNNSEEIKAYQADYHQKHRAKHNAQSREYRRQNPEQDAKRVQEWVEANPGRRRAIANKYVKTPKGVAARVRRRARERNLPDTFIATEWQSCLQYWRHTCAYCGGLKPLSADHFEPLASADSPGTVAENMLPACKSCNSSKQHRDPVEWLASRYNEFECLEILARIVAYFDIL